MTTDTFKFKAQPSYVIMDTSAASGGVTYSRESLFEHDINDGDGQEKEWKTNKRTDHKELCKEADAIKNKASALLRKRCACLTWKRAESSSADALSFTSFESRHLMHRARPQPHLRERRSAVFPPVDQRTVLVLLILR